MLSDEEEKAIKTLKKDKNKPLSCGDITIVGIEDLQIVLNLIEKLTKENEELKAKYYFIDGLRNENKYMHKELDNQQLTINNYAKENQQLKKQIELMANFIDDVDKDDKICSIIGEEVCNTFDNGILNCINCIKQYFENLAKGEEDR